ncbi:hypothetical protein LXL04_038098 [Taraxacum kok-saghyz]
MAVSFNEKDKDYVNSTLVEAVEVKSGPDGFVIKTRDGKHLRCAHNNPQGRHLPNYAPHPAIVLKMEDGTGLLLPIIVLYIIIDRISRVTPAVIESINLYLTFAYFIDNVAKLY